MPTTGLTLHCFPSYFIETRLFPRLRTDKKKTRMRFPGIRKLDVNGFRVTWAVWCARQPVSDLGGELGERQEQPNEGQTLPSGAASVVTFFGGGGERQDWRNFDLPHN